MVELLNDENIELSHIIFSTEAGLATIKDINRSGSWPRCSNIVIGAFVTAYARICLHKALIKNVTRNIYADTDSVISLYNKNDDRPKTGIHLGQMTDEIKEAYGLDAKCIGFRSIGCKSYSMKIRANDKMVYQTKLKGVTLTNDVMQLINFESLGDMLKDTELSVNVINKRFVAKRGEGVTSNEYASKNVKYTYNKRVILNDVDYPTVPYGTKNARLYYDNIDPNFYAE